VRDPRLKSIHTRRGYLADLESFEEWRNGRYLTRSLVEEFAAMLQSAGRSPNTINRKLSAIRWYARRLVMLIEEIPAFTDQEQRQRAEMIAQAERVASVDDVRGERELRGRHLGAGELQALMAACENDPTPAGARDAAIFALSWVAGLRRDEIAGLAIEDYQRVDRSSADLKVRGKGDKPRTAYLFEGAYRALVDWLKIRGDQPGSIFCVIDKGGNLDVDHHLSGEAMRLILEKRIEEAKTQHLTWHDFRRTFAGNLLDAGTDLATVQKLMGHKDPTTTSNYDRRGEEVKRRAVKTLFVPYRGRLV
jgi:site-specific recombinase XerD